MAAFELLLSQARRHCLTRTPFQLSLLLRSHSSSSLPFLGFHRSLSSSSPPSESSSEPNPEAPPNEPPRKPQSIPVQVVSYPVKSKDQSPPQEESSQPTPPSRRTQQPDAISEKPINAEARTWSREDIRYVKDVPTISPVSYPAKVAPLPEDRAAASAGEVTAKVEDKKGDEQSGRERRRIEADNQIIKRVFKVEEEKVPFPTLIKVESNKKEKIIYDLKDAIRLLKANAKRNFDETVEAHVRMAVELRRTDLKLSGSVRLPHGLGKAVRVAVFAEGAAADEARAAGADIVGGQELIEGIKNGNVKVDFTKCISTPQLMPRVGKEISKILRRLTPNPKSGTVTNDVSRVVREAKENIDIKKDKYAIVHVGLGKASFAEEALRENVGAFVNALLLAKPVGLKKSSKYAGYVSSFHLCSTMGTSFAVSIQSLSDSCRSLPQIATEVTCSETFRRSDFYKEQPIFLTVTLKSLNLKILDQSIMFYLHLDFGFSSFLQLRVCNIMLSLLYEVLNVSNRSKMGRLNHPIQCLTDKVHLLARGPYKNQGSSWGVFHFSLFTDNCHPVGVLRKPA
ncbi:hypothetical protein F0562_008522 [Nyssa sinensis]|uniref:CL1 n=1 Tax=Nyssa sinensis TaxID=561372 RepID=A0A5J5A583_9ASTE|nr:hypothetical protein F0562_008522 [Nyssa sinensis]